MEEGLSYIMAPESLESVCGGESRRGARRAPPTPGSDQTLILLMLCESHSARDQQ